MGLLGHRRRRVGQAILQLRPAGTVIVLAFIMVFMLGSALSLRYLNFQPPLTGGHGVRQRAHQLNSSHSSMHGAVPFPTFLNTRKSSAL
jgi:hypothetical protein